MDDVGWMILDFGLAWLVGRMEKAARAATPRRGAFCFNPCFLHPCAPASLREILPWLRRSRSALSRRGG